MQQAYGNVTIYVPPIDADGDEETISRNPQMIADLQRAVVSNSHRPERVRRLGLTSQASDLLAFRPKDFALTEQLKLKSSHFLIYFDGLK